jgi:RHS repeat-associated protein
VTKGSSTFFYHQDGLGSVTDLTDASGATAKSYSYDVYGNILESPGTLEQPYSYTARELDSETGLYYYRARNYDSQTGRFLQKDPIGFKGGDANLYRYVSNNPGSFNDPLGLQCSCGEEITAIAAVGLLDTYRANQLAEEAFKKADQTGFPGRGSGVRDAFRHCYWSCRMAQEIGPDQAKKVGDIHEECERGTSAVGDTAMDIKNNSVGRAYGTPGADCYFGCAGGVKSGVLQTSPGGTVPKGPIY